VRLFALLSLMVVVPLGFGLKFYDGPGRLWPNNYGAAVMYEIFWCLAAFALFPSVKHAAVIAVAVFVATCVLECLQVCDAAVFRWVRSYEIGRYLIGTTFAWWDFPHYIAGCALGWAWMKALGGTARRR
jgi:hypothetical protein